MGTRPVLLDVGASRRIDRAARLSANVGTLTWLSPEQAAPGDVGVPSPPSDVWGLGISLLYALTGRFSAMLRGPRPGEVEQQRRG